MASRPKKAPASRDPRNTPNALISTDWVEKKERRTNNTRRKPYKRKAAPRRRAPAKKRRAPLRKRAPVRKRATAPKIAPNVAGYLNAFAQAGGAKIPDGTIAASHAQKHSHVSELATGPLMAVGTQGHIDILMVPSLQVDSNGLLRLTSRKRWKRRSIWVRVPFSSSNGP
eukprot:scaffold20821_cov47-Attheya_sp.AAC.2